MRFISFCVPTLLLGFLAVVARSEDKPDPNVASTPHRTPEEERKLFRLPPGFEIQLGGGEYEDGRHPHPGHQQSRRCWPGLRPAAPVI